MAAKDDLGRAGEQQAADYLTKRGYRIVDRNWRCPQGELDIVAIIGPHVAVVEVKTRRSAAFGHPFDAIDDCKRRRLWRLAYAWRAAHPELARGRALRVEAVGIIGASVATASIEHLEDIA
ncbi:YraN family protein [Microbacterium paraoxydans]|uniref:YraN family protein n=1 Tax=Microbacterium paraoxydans TaxID=199592 RepID=UPI0021A31BFF|nr:YraN family protein [Microbacterium paraoxydans]MCT2222832.1 YraN family protein [Microbacterium paraoxydans]